MTTYSLVDMNLTLARDRTPVLHTSVVPVQNPVFDPNVVPVQSNVFDSNVVPVRYSCAYRALCDTKNEQVKNSRV
ncbi:hypothetical protein SNE40_005376 [Patella caerulea]|uniref:Uncharacterized protein n=1 Tax=Patella caerulea TaxID=87958 RepID=A0AAN8PXD1_PATCE